MESYALVKHVVLCACIGALAWTAGEAGNGAAQRSHRGLPANSTQFNIVPRVSNSQQKRRCLAAAPGVRLPLACRPNAARGAEQHRPHGGAALQLDGMGRLLGAARHCEPRGHSSELAPGGLRPRPPGRLRERSRAAVRAAAAGAASATTREEEEERSGSVLKRAFRSGLGRGMRKPGSLVTSGSSSSS